MASGDGRRLQIDGVEIHDGGACYVIAEIGNNHQGSLEQAKQLVDAAKECGADAVKLQKRANRALYTREFFDQPYDNEFSFGRTYGEHREALELSASELAELQAHAREIGITFFATAFDFESADLLAELDVPAFKFASGDIRNTPLLASRRRFREADDSLDRRRGACGRRPRGRGHPAPQRPALRSAVHSRLSRRHGRPEPERDHDAARAVPAIS